MITRIPPSYQSPAVAAGRADDHRPVSRRRFATFLTALLVAGFVAGVSAEAPPEPLPNEVVANCVLNSAEGATVDQLKLDLGAAGITSPEVDFVLVYTLQNPNDGQSTTGGFTGPVLCRRNPTFAESGVSVTPTNENTPIPGGTDTVDITALEQALILQYEKAGGIREKRVCHTVAGKTDCFLITPVDPVGEGS